MDKALAFCVCKARNTGSFLTLPDSHVTNWHHQLPQAPNNFSISSAHSRVHKPNAIYVQDEVHLSEPLENGLLGQDSLLAPHPLLCIYSVG